MSDDRDDLAAPGVRRRHLALRSAVIAGTALRHGGRALARRALARRAPNGSGGLAELVADLGPAFVKGAQLLSTRRDLLDPKWCDAMGGLHDQVRPMSRPQAVQALHRAYPAQREWPFRRFDATAVASGSIASVYRAELHDSTEVAVKLRRPGLHRLIGADLRLVAAGAGLVQRLPAMRRVPAARIVDQVSQAIRRQLDLDLEAQALRTLRANLGDFARVRIPAPIPAACGDGALVMEFVPGLRRFGPDSFTREQRRELVRQVLHAVYRMLFVDGLVHCDMHPGNLYLNPDGNVVLLDAGFVVPLQPHVKRLFAEFFLNMSLGRGPECAEVVLRSAEHVPPEADLPGFRADIVELVATTAGRRAGDFQLAPFATRLFDLQRRSGVAAAPEFVFPLLSMLVLEGMINEFDVDVDFQAEAIPTLLPALNR
ncbi:AarF/UbiB family protein [Saccharopolyspora sp. NPDC050642]|uniref:ABC1 kinase family protein n=1 Tax=Saccharopolyspora sp. NPDC050642 TaxID=3157099 RepID=UPI0033DAD744